MMLPSSSSSSSSLSSCQSQYRIKIHCNTNTRSKSESLLPRRRCTISIHVVSVAVLFFLLSTSSPITAVSVTASSIVPSERGLQYDILVRRDRIATQLSRDRKITTSTATRTTSSDDGHGKNQKRRRNLRSDDHENFNSNNNNDNNSDNNNGNDHDDDIFSNNEEQEQQQQQQQDNNANQQQQNLSQNNSSGGGASQSENENDPGWVPSSYPDPLTSPALCRIPENLWNSKANSGTDTTAETATSTAATSTTSDQINTNNNGNSNNQPENSNPSILLCDPDQSLSNEDLEDIGLALVNFSSRYGRNSKCDSDNDNNENGTDDDNSQNGKNGGGHGNGNGKGTNNNQQKGKNLYNVGLAQNWDERDRWIGSTFEIENMNADATRGKISSLGGSFVSPSKSSESSSSRKGSSSNNNNNNNSNNNNNNSSGNSSSGDANKSLQTRIEIGVAVTDRIDATAVLHEFRFYTFEDEDSMTDDAAQFFASYLHNKWFSENNNVNGGVPGNHNSCGDGDDDIQGSVEGILIFLSVEDKVCFISSGDSISSILPWWRLERVVEGMKENLRTKNYGDAIVGAIDDISDMIKDGPPTLTEKMHDFSVRFGLIFVFSICTFVLAVYGELRERRKRFEYAEINTRLDEVEEEKARILQQSFKTDCCPICLEDLGSQSKDESKAQVDKYGIPLYGSDSKPLKMLRCGHIFCTCCWKAWVNSGNGNPYSCPVCRRDIAKPEEKATPPTEQNSTPLIDESSNTQSYGAISNPSFINNNNSDSEALHLQDEQSNSSSGHGLVSNSSALLSIDESDRGEQYRDTSSLDSDIVYDDEAPLL